MFGGIPLIGVHQGHRSVSDWPRRQKGVGIKPCLPVLIASVPSVIGSPRVGPSGRGYFEFSVTRTGF
jgi:hypothetical protein